MSRLYPLGCAFALLLLATAAHAQDAELNDVRATVPGIHTVQSGGFWDTRQQEGFYRVVVTSGGFEHVIARLFVQWITTDQDTREYKVVRTVAVKEVGIASVIVPAVKFVTGSGPATIDRTISRRDGKREKRTVIAQPDGRYSFR